MDYLVALEALSGNWNSLPAAERAVVQSAGEIRRREFATGRIVARRLLTALGARPGPLLPAESGAPSWPAGYTGSIAHSRSACLVVVARRGLVEALGVDIEDVHPIAPATWPLILTDTEHRGLEANNQAAGLSVLRSFCAKEAAFKSGIWPDERRFEPRHFEISWEANEMFSARNGHRSCRGQLLRTAQWLCAVVLSPACAASRREGAFDVA